MKKHLAIILAAAVSAFSAALSAAPVNVNTAGAEEIAQALNGIGEVKAQAIIEDRKSNGPFKTVEDLARVKGIGEKTVEKNKEDIKL